MSAHMKLVVKRFAWDVSHLFSKQNNPYIDEDNEESGLKAKHRTGVEDIGHAAKNVIVEAEREIDHKH